MFSLKAYAAAAAATLTTFAAVTAPAEESHAIGDAEIVAIYTQVNSFDIETALLALSKRCDPEVTALATHLSKDHLGVRKAVLELSEEQSLGYSLPSTRRAAQMTHDTVMARLSALDCGDFEPAFLEHDVAFHTAAIEAVKTVLLPKTTNAALRAHFEAVLPAFAQHLSMAIVVKEGGSISQHEGAH